jgi:undecaprenyl-diphosphatase
MFDTGSSKSLIMRFPIDHRLTNRLQSIVDSGREKFGRIGLRELSLLAALSIVIGGVWIFVKVSEEVSDGNLHVFDHAIMMSLRVDGVPSRPVGAQWFPEAARDITALVSYSIVILVTVLVIGFLLLRRWVSEALLWFFTITWGGILSQVLKTVFQRERPDFAFHLTNVSTFSFPSGHAIFATLVYIPMGALLARSLSRRCSKIYCLFVGVLLAMLVGLTRIYLGVHFPSDVLAGWVAGSSWAMLCWIIWQCIQRRGKLCGRDSRLLGFRDASDQKCCVSERKAINPLHLYFGPNTDETVVFNRSKVTTSRSGTQ